MIVKGTRRTGGVSNPGPMPAENALTPSPQIRSTRPWRRLLSALVAASLVAGAPPAGAQVRLPALGDSASDDMSISAERRIGDEIMREGRRDPAFLDDPVLLAYVQSLWNPLVAAARAKGDIDADTDQSFAWEIFLVLDRSVNAFALPGGYVGVHLGLVALTSTPDQLASVLAHELSHVTQRHIARSIAPQQRASLLAVVGMLLGVMAASRSSSADTVNAAVVGSQAAAIQSQINYTRDMEREADRVGFGILTRAGYASTGMAGMFEKLDTATRLNDNNGFPYLRTHPLTVDRISEARNRTLLAGAAPSTPTLMHAAMQARARVLMDDDMHALQRLRGESSSPLLTDQVGALYGGAMAASRLREPERAEQLALDALRLAARATPREAAAEKALTLLLAQVRMEGGQATAALQTLDRLSAPTAPAAEDRPALLLRAQALLVQHHRAPGSNGEALRSSTEALQTWLADRPQDAAAWSLLARTSEALGLHLRSMRAAAEAHAAVGDLGGAIDRLRAAQGLSRGARDQGQQHDFIEATVIDMRLRQLTAQRRQIALDARGGRSAPEEGTR